MTIDYPNHSFIEPLKLSLDMEHHLNVIKEISVTDSFLLFDECIRECHEESYDECTTKKYKKIFFNQCKCLPLQLRLNEQVSSISNKFK